MGQLADRRTFKAGLQEGREGLVRRETQTVEQKIKWDGEIREDLYDSLEEAESPLESDY